MPQAVQFGQEPADGRQIELRGLQVAGGAAARGRGKEEELADVAGLGVHGMRGRIAIETEVIEEGAQLARHDTADGVIHSPSTRSARSLVAALRSALPLRPPLASGGGMMPKVMLVG